MKKSLFYLALFSLSASCVAADLSSQQVTSLVKAAIEPLMEQQAIPGMSVAVLYKGRAQFVNLGVADLESRRRVTENTLFELGSVSKTFTGTLAGIMLRNGEIRLNDPVQKRWPQLTGEQWRPVRMLHLATYTAGGLPLQLPDEVTDQASLLRFYQNWQPTAAPGLQRQYSNASIGLFGLLMVKGDYEQAMERHVFQPLRLTRTYITVPPSMMLNYAWGYKNGQPVRVSPGMLDAEAYGIKSTARDMLTFMQANIDPNRLSAGNAVLRNAIRTAQSRYFKVGSLYQGLGWEIYDWPVDAETLLRDNDNAVALKPRPATQVNPVGPSQSASWVHKTGATNGFGAYIAFIPEQNSGIVLLANKNYPNPLRISVAWQILQALQQGAPK
ncbi:MULTISPECIES: class C beta-lactamase [unclassified Pantoea]|uniref:class C beta-lactamase n=1 Tax=unclassified Pantoea TaxID=2630326 RepID=UPI0024772E5D|nr:MULTISPECIES: class C beta-lactamase [unclassified Pantoea]GME43096.1 class C beta-lactamase [Pantoea sp. QMID1]GME43149.1 class C beta-lactamase [Pantoea sp. QMID3]GME58032.1 class C beta-lactamase [Pantoea sp. QMID4]GME59392.1 class C beta-lactamase [Pantoea sp. QMID2]